MSKRELCAKLGLAEEPVIELGHLTLAQKRAYVIADNHLVLNAGWDEEMLAIELAELSVSGYNLSTQVVPGFAPVSDGQTRRQQRRIDHVRKS